MNENGKNELTAQKTFVDTKYTNNLTKRAIWYLNAGYPLHLRGPAGVGKTTLAFHIAENFNNPIIYICGSQELGEKELIGDYGGYKKRLLEDNYIRSVYRMVEEHKKIWNEGKLVTACRNGYTFIYDEFTRAETEVNNILLPILEEKILVLPESVEKVHPEFRIIFTSNPNEYVGVHKSANALIDRMITIDIDAVDEETEQLIIMSKSGLSMSEAQKIQRITNLVRAGMQKFRFVSIRCSIILADIINKQKIKISADNQIFLTVCMDIYSSMLINEGMDGAEKETLSGVIADSVNKVVRGGDSYGNY